jgi:hypothetical protein
VTDDDIVVFFGQAHTGREVIAAAPVGVGIPIALSTWTIGPGRRPRES